jgi:radical SAM superfamily enzyme YgiQ (UPF0313 family)
MNILLVYPQYPDSFWSFKHALRFISKKAAVPPLGLITVSAMLPSTWQKKLVDMNVTTLKTKDIQWADYVFISAMHIQKESVNFIIEECVKLGVKIVAGGPLFTQDYQNYPQIDHLVLNEAEITLPFFLKDLSDGHPGRIYKTSGFPDIKSTPVPDFHLLAMKSYALMNIQVSRGCPFSCEFCEITGNNTDLSLNFVPRMNHNELISGYKKIIRGIYTTKPYYKRIRRLLLNYRPHRNKPVRIDLASLKAFLKSTVIIGVINKGRSEYWKLLIWTLFRRPKLMADAIEYSIYGYHYRTVYGLRNKVKD